MEQSLPIIDALKAAFENMSWVEIGAVITGLAYVILAVRENIWCWIFGIANALLSIYLFYIGNLYSESILYFYYVLAGIYGWYAWSGNQSNEASVLDQSGHLASDLKIHVWSLFSHLKAIIIGVVGALLLAFIMKNFTDAKIPLLDAFTTVFSFIATYMVARKVLENWLYWIIVDVVTTWMYFDREYYLYALLMIVYTIIAVVGYIKWRKAFEKDLSYSIKDN